MNENTYGHPLRAYQALPGTERYSANCRRHCPPRCPNSTAVNSINCAHSGRASKHVVFPRRSGGRRRNAVRSQFSWPRP